MSIGTVVSSDNSPNFNDLMAGTMLSNKNATLGDDSNLYCRQQMTEKASNSVNDMQQSHLCHHHYHTTQLSANCCSVASPPLQDKLATAGPVQDAADTVAAMSLSQQQQSQQQSYHKSLPQQQQQLQQHQELEHQQQQQQLEHQQQQKYQQHQWRQNIIQSDDALSNRMKSSSDPTATIPASNNCQPLNEQCLDTRAVTSAPSPVNERNNDEFSQQQTERTNNTALVADNAGGKIRDGDKMVTKTSRVMAAKPAFINGSSYTRLNQYELKNEIGKVLTLNCI